MFGIEISNNGRETHYRDEMRVQRVNSRTSGTWKKTSSLLIRKLLTAPQERYALFFKSSTGRTVKVPAPAPIAILARSMGSTRQTNQINESIKIAINEITHFGIESARGTE